MATEPVKVRAWYEGNLSHSRNIAPTAICRLATACLLGGSGDRSQPQLHSIFGVEGSIDVTGWLPAASVDSDE